MVGIMLLLVVDVSCLPGLAEGKGGEDIQRWLYIEGAGLRRRYKQCPHTLALSGPERHARNTNTRVNHRKVSL